MKHIDDERAAAWAADRLSGEEAAELLAHAEGCQPCAELMARSRSAALGDVTRPQVGTSPDETGSLAPASPAPARRPALLKNTLVGRYLVLDELGHGGMGVVWAAYDPELDRRVALKLLQASPASNPAFSSGQGRLLREAQAMARLSHPNVVPVYDVGSYGDQVFMAMELVEGATLKAWVREKERGRAELLEVFAAAGRGLAAAHAAGLVHRDFKPENVLVGKDGRVRVTDFGLVRLAGAEGAMERPQPLEDRAESASSRSSLLESHLTQAGLVMGTPAYMAPEQFRGAPADGRTDQFSFAVALYEALYGERPFGEGPLAACIANTLEGRVLSPSKEAGVPAWLRRVLLRALRATPDERYPTMDALLDALAQDPSVKLRRAAYGLALLAFAGATLAAAHYVNARGRLMCTGAARKLTGVWDAQVKAEAKGAFDALRLAYGEDAWARTEKALDAYAQGYTAMHTEACEATRLRGEQSEEVLSLRMDCLEQRRQELKALADLLKAPDPALVQKAPVAASALATLSSCADVPGLRAPVPLPGRSEVRAQVGQVRARLSEARALLNAGRYAAGVIKATALVHEAERTGYLPVEAEARALLGELQSLAGDLPSSERNLTAAGAEADTGHDDPLRARAWIELAG